MELAVNTPAGRDADQKKYEAMSALLPFTPWDGWIPFNDNEPSVVDGIIYQNGFVIAIVECRAREFTMNTFWGAMEGKWLITEDKLLRGSEVCKFLKVPMVGVLYAWPDKTLLVRRLINKLGEIVDYERGLTETRETINGGQATRWNAYIPMHSAKVFPVWI